MSNDLIKKRNERTKSRKEFKKKVDKIYNLSYKDDEKMILSADAVISLADGGEQDPVVRLLDEGAVVGDESVRFIIKKGTLAKFMGGNNEVLPNIDPSETYTVNLGHMDFATFPILLGEWKKSDLTLVDIGDERKGVDVAVHLYSENPLVQQLKRQPYDVGVSAEFNYHVDWETTFDIGILTIDEVYIFAYGIVGECGNVNSSGLELKGETMAKNAIDQAIEAEILDTEEEQLGVEEVEIPTTAEAEPTTETESNTELTEEAGAGTAEAESENGEEAESEEVSDEDTDDEADDDEAEDDTEVLSLIANLKAQVESLTEANAKLKKANKKLSGKYQRELEKKEKFKEGLKGLSVELLPDEEEKTEKLSETKVTKTSYYRGDGIGEI